MEEEKMYVSSGLKTKDGKDIMCYTGAFYLKNNEKYETNAQINKKHDKLFKEIL